MAEDRDVAPRDDAWWRGGHEAYEARKLYPDSLIAELANALPGFVDEAARARFPGLIHQWATITLIMRRPSMRDGGRIRSATPKETRDALKGLVKQLQAVERQLRALPDEARYALGKARLPPEDDVSNGLEGFVRAFNATDDIGRSVASFARAAKRAAASVYVPLGRRPKHELKAALHALATIFLSVTGERPAESNDGGQRGGKFRAFATRAIRPLWPDDAGMGFDGLLAEVYREVRENPSAFSV